MRCSQLLNKFIAEYARNEGIYPEKVFVSISFLELVSQVILLRPYEDAGITWMGVPIIPVRWLKNEDMQTKEKLLYCWIHGNE